ncbi:MAG: ShlB/FhaC/HecB family hemolysin secretion/activation protein [Verrucomicrobia bacterium]|nr:MAG: ShlB/FhaC/HecB family hemolysin secretion/activation protein [Verrucomicrobiota bacterium]
MQRKAAELFGSLSFFLASMEFLRIFFLILIGGTPLWAQLRDSQVADPQRADSTRSSLQRAAAAVISSNEVLIPSLRGLVVVADPDLVGRIARPAAEGISCHGFSESQQKKMIDSLQPWLQQPVSLDRLEQMARAAEKAAATQSDSFITATYPPQEITEGRIVMVLQEPLLQQISFAGKPRFGKNFLARAVRTRPGGRASAESIRKDLDFLNRNPFRTATALWSPAESDVPAANLILHIQEKRPWSLYTGVDNDASDALGDERFYLGGKFGNVMGLDHRLGWLALTSADGTSLHSTHFTYEIPLSGHKILTFSSGLSESASSSPTTLIDNNGRFWSFRNLLEVPLPDLGPIRHHGKTGYSFRDNRYRQEASLIDISIFQFENTWVGEIHDLYGRTHVTMGLSWNPGESFLSSSDRIYQELGASDANSWVATCQIERNLSLHRWGNLALTSEAQWALENLIPSNQFAGGGAQRVRGYDEGRVFFDKALLLSTEWQFPRIALPRRTSLRPHLFLDGAWLADHGSSSNWISSTGLGMQFLWQNRCSAQLQWAQPFQRFNGASRESEFYFSVNTFW